MKPSNYLTILLILSFLFLPLAACTGASETTTQSASSSGDLPLASQLALGILKLEETSYPIDKTQAAELLPLWKALRALSTSDTTAPQEIEALVKQIQNSLSAEQINAITTMNLTNEDIMTYMQAQGPMANQSGATPDSSAQATRQARIQSAVQSGAAGGGPGGGGPGGGAGGGPGGGGMPGGGFGGGVPPDGGAGMPGMASGTPGVIPQNSSGVNVFLINLVIRFLEAK